VLFYPNPVSEALNISTIGAAHNITHVEIYNVTGNRILEQTFSEKDRVVLDVSSIPTGVYFCKVNMANTSVCLKFVKS